MPNLIAWRWRTSRPIKNKFSARLALLLTAMLLVPLPLLAGALSNHPSPYIRLHADDAVDWRIWEPGILQQAKKQNKLVFISIGYFACHWCHVMREQSFNNTDVAKLLNAHFISVKVDRELNPALDNYLMNFVQLTRGYGGWPLNVFVTPEGYPLVGMVYLPQAEFLKFIQRLDNDWRSDTRRLATLARQAFDYSRQIAGRSQPMPTPDKLDELLMQAVRQNADELSGGFGSQAKFPQPALLLALLEYQQLNEDSWLKEFLQLTLEQMVNQGLHDVIGGGFFRYTVDPLWHTPHYEKMLYTNAGMALVYMRAYEIYGDEKYLQIALETIDFMLREMWSPQGFVSALSAQDKQGAEGAAYVWQRDELQQALTAEQWQKIGSFWQLIDIAEPAGVLPAGLALGKHWQPIRQRLLKKRRAHQVPVDDKALMSWNGYALSALARALRLGGRDDLKRHGDILYGLLQQQVEQGLARRSPAGEQHFLEDYAFVAQGMLDWAEVSDRSFAAGAAELGIKALTHFAGDTGWRLSDEQILPLPVDQLNIADAQLPSPEIVVLRLAQRLGIAHRQPVRKQLDAFRNRVDAGLLQNPMSFASHVVFARQMGTGNISTVKSGQSAD